MGHYFHHHGIQLPPFFFKVKTYIFIKKKKKSIGVPIMAQRLTNLTSIQEDTGSIPGLAQWVGDPVLS